MFENLEDVDVAEFNIDVINSVTQEDIDGFIVWLKRTTSEQCKNLDELCQDKAKGLTFDGDINEFEVFKYVQAIKMGYLLAKHGGLDAK